MDLGPVRAQEAVNVAGVTRAVTALSAQSQAAAQANDPFAAYLLSLSSPDAIIRAALAQAVTGGGRAGDAARAVLAAGALGVDALTPAGTAAALQATGTVATGPADRLATALAAAQAAQDGGAGLVQEPAAEAGAAQATAPVQDQGSAQAQARVQAQAAASERVAEDLATLAANAAALNAYGAATTAGAVSQAASGVATDATAKYMGAGALALNQGPGSAAAQAAAAYLALQEVIPAVIATPSSPPLSANAESTPQGRTPANLAPAPLRRAAGRGTFPFQVLDLTG